MTHKARRSAAWLAAATVASVLWSALLLLAPGWLAGASQQEAVDARATAATVTYLMASRVCHQRSERSFHLHARPMPVCGRCAGLYLAGTAGLLAGVARRARTARPAARRRTLGAHLDPRALWLAAAALPTALTWGTEMLGLWNPGTVLRALTAAPLGLMVGVFIAARRP